MITVVKFDVMKVVDGDLRYVCTMSMKNSDILPPSDSEWLDYVVEQRPSLAKCRNDLRLKIL